MLPCVRVYVIRKIQFAVKLPYSTATVCALPHIHMRLRKRRRPRNARKRFHRSFELMRRWAQQNRLTDRDAEALGGLQLDNNCDIGAMASRPRIISVRLRVQRDLSAPRAIATVRRTASAATTPEVSWLAQPRSV